MNGFGVPPKVQTVARGFCTHSATRVVIMPPPRTHYARLECASCRPFLKFLVRPESVERRKLNGFRLGKLAMRPGLNSWQRGFVDSLSKQGGNKRAPQQQAVFDELCAIHLREGGAQQ